MTNLESALERRTGAVLHGKPIVVKLIPGARVTDVISGKAVERQVGPDFVELRELGTQRKYKVDVLTLYRWAESASVSVPIKARKVTR